VSAGQRFVVNVEGIDHVVIVEPSADATHMRARVGERTFELSHGPHDTLLVRAESSSAHVAVHIDDSMRPESAHAAGRTFALRTRSAREAAAEAARAAASGGIGDGVIRAPMPGRVVRVLVAIGDEVAADAPLFIVEAMKMENEVRAPAAGHVASIAVGPADTVEAGQILCELRAEPATAD
jgi:glutaconyl-CoA/methylmalonyl-CoA decarboxylase subunit gamma